MICEFYLYKALCKSTISEAVTLSTRERKILMDEMYFSLFYTFLKSVTSPSQKW